MTPAFSANSGFGFRQYKYCLVSKGCRYDIFPNVDSLQKKKKKLHISLIMSKSVAVPFKSVVTFTAV